jgi:Ca2+-binding EF-hand superfamily protein
MTNPIPTRALVLMTLIAVGTVASAAPGDRAGLRGGPDFAALDANSDGVITQSDLSAAAQARFAALDADEDGQVSPTELAARAEMHAEDRRARHAGAMLERFDTNGDGSLSLEEMSTGDRAERMFARADADKDGQITRAEFEAMGRHDHPRGGPRSEMR